MEPLNVYALKLENVTCLMDDKEDVMIRKDLVTAQFKSLEKLCAIGRSLKSLVNTYNVFVLPANFGVSVKVQLSR